MNRSLATALAASMFIAALIPAAASAQRPLQQVLDLNRQAMDAYNNLEIEQAQTLLQQALDAATRGRVTGAPLARTYVNLGVVAIAGTGDNGAGLNYFVSALQADASVALDPLLSTPDIELIWTQAHARSGGTTTQVTPPPVDTTQTTGSGDLAHTPITEQLRATPVPVYVEVPGRPAHVYLYYRGHGMRDFERAEMDHVGRGYGYEIPCGDVFEPEVAYYIAVFDASGSPISFAGSQGSPISVPIVATRSTSAPALPGRAPPTQCTSMEEECPPDLPGCHTTASTGTRGLGDSCRVDNDCTSGNCADDLCALNDGHHDEEDHPQGEYADAPRFFVRLTPAVGLSYVTTGMPTDRNVCNQDVAAGDPAGCDAVDNPQPVPGADYNHITTVGHPSDGGNGGSSTYGYDDTGIRSDPGNGVGGLNVGEAQTCPFTDRHCFYVESPGMVANFALRLEVGYYIVPRWLAVSVNARFQPISGVGTMSFLQLGGRLETELTEPGATGPVVQIHAGGGGGQIQVFLPRRSDVGQYAPWGASGYGYIDFGANVGYRFMRNFAVLFQPTFVFSVPSFLFTLDLGVSFEVGF